MERERSDSVPVADPLADIQALSKNCWSGIILEFLEAFIHQLLYIRNIYPPEIFERRRKYGLPIHMSRHPDLNQYIYQMLRHVAPLLDEGLVEKVAICFLDPLQTPVERYVVDLQEMDFSNFQQDALAPEEANFLGELEDQLRASLIKLNFVDNSLAVLPEDATFTTFVYTREFPEIPDGERKKKEDFMNDQVQKSNKWMDTTFQDAEFVGDEKIVLPIKSFSIGDKSLQLYAEALQASIIM